MAGTFTTANIAYIVGSDVAMCGADIGDCQVVSALATCPAGSIPLAGGWLATSNDVIVMSSRAVGGGSWEVTAINYATNIETISARAVCTAT